MTTATKSNSQAAAAVLGELGALVTENGQKLHGATFDDAPHDDGDEVREMSDSSGASLGDKIAELLDQIDQGFQADDASNLQKLAIARKYGPMLLELKEIAPHGTFKLKLKERFPKISYAKCNRWMFLASHETEVAAAIEKYPDVAWGPKKMIDFLKGSWTPEPEDEDDWLEEDEEESDGFVKDDFFEVEPQVSDATESDDSGVSGATVTFESQPQDQGAIQPFPGERLQSADDAGDSDRQAAKGQTSAKKHRPASEGLAETIKYRASIQSNDTMALKAIEQIADDHGIPFVRRTTSKTVTILCKPSADKMNEWLCNLGHWIQVNKPGDLRLTIQS